MTDVRQQLTEALDEVERLAKAALYHPIGEDEDNHADQATHIARWDPSTVLRLVARDRELLAEHDKHIESLGTGDEIEDMAVCVACSELVAGVIGFPCREVERLAAFWLGTPEAGG